MSSGMMFCPECNNMLQPKEDRARLQLKFLCRRCDFFRYADKTYEENCVDKINFSYKSKEDIIISRDLCQDPTLGRINNWLCPLCNSYGCIFFQLPERIAEDAMTLVYVCINYNCGYSTQQYNHQHLDHTEDSPETMARVKSIGQVKPQPQEEEAAAAAAAAAAGAAAGAAGAGAAANPPDTAADAAEEEPKIDEEGVDSEGDGDLFGDDDQGYIYNNELEEEIAQNDEFNQEIQENELEQEIALEGAAATATGEEGDEELNII